MLQIETVRRTLGKTTYVTPMLLTNMGDEALDRDKECWKTTIQDFFDALTIENIWDYVPNALKWVGIAIIVASGLFIIWRERITAQRDRATQERG